MSLSGTVSNTARRYKPCPCGISIGYDKQQQSDTVEPRGGYDYFLLLLGKSLI